MRMRGRGRGDPGRKWERERVGTLPQADHLGGEWRSADVLARGASDRDPAGPRTPLPPGAIPRPAGILDRREFARRQPPAEDAARAFRAVDQSTTSPARLPR